jgi:hypothetical protein
MPRGLISDEKGIDKISEACRFMALASRDFSSMPPTSYFLSNGKENARKPFFSLPMKKLP